jgi:hypothetical protein
MKRILSSFAVLLFSASLLSAETATLIDFGNLTDDSEGQNAATTIDLSSRAGSNMTDEDKAKLKTSLFIGNWKIDYNSSAANIDARRLTKVVPVQSNQLGKTVMGVRAVFPSIAANSYIVVRPPFSIPAYDINAEQQDAEQTEGSSVLAKSAFDNNGIVKNVGSLKSMSLTVRGLNYPHKVTLLIADFYNKVREIPMGSLNFDGWKQLNWTNPNYVYDVGNLELSRMPLYPYTVPLIRLVGIKFTRDGSTVGDNFITYISDISITYDKAVRDDQAIDIDDDAVWQILKSRDQDRFNAETARFSDRVVLEYDAQQRLDSSTPNNYPQDGKVTVNTSNPLKSGSGATDSGATDTAAAEQGQ